MKSRAGRVALRISLIYALIAGAWILLSGRALMAFVAPPEIRNQLEIYKGWAFVAVTALLLYLVLRRQLRRMEQESRDRELAEAALSESDQRFRALVEQAADAFFVHDRNGRILDLNRLACESLGYAKEKLLRMNMLDFEQDFDLTHAQAVWDGIQPGETLTLNERHWRKNGTFSPVEIRLGCLDLGGQRYFLALARDMTERRRHEEELRRFRFSIEQASDAVFWIDCDASFTFVNDQACRLLGYTREELLKLHLWDIDPVFPRERWEAQWEQFHNEPRIGSRQFETMHRRKDGTDFPVEVSAKQIWFGGAELHVAFVRDITDRKRKEHRLQRLTDCCLGFGTDPAENINHMTALCGELLGATCALYNRLEGELLCSLGQWHTPPDYVPRDEAQGHICYDVIRRGSDDIFTVRNLPETAYFKSDPNVARYRLKTYVGKAVRFSNAAVGSLCVTFDRDYEPDTEDQRLITLIAAAIGIEESRLQARENLRRREESYHALADNLPDPVARIDRDLRFVYVNRALEQSLGMPASALLGKTSRELNLPACELWDALTRAVFDSGNSRSFEYEVPCPDGRHYFEARLAPERSATGKVEFVLALTRDLTEQKQAEIQRQKPETPLRRSQKLEAIG